MKRLYARFVLWLIQPALELRARHCNEHRERVIADFERENPPGSLAADLQRMTPAVDSREIEGPSWTISDDGAFAFRRLTDDEIRHSGAKPLPNRKIIEKPREQDPKKGVSGAAGVDPQA